MAETRLLASGDTVLVVEFGDSIDWRISRRVTALESQLRREPLAGVIETVPTFRSLAVHYDPDTISFESLGERLTTVAADAEVEDAPARLWRIPGCYDPEFGPDLDAVGEQAGLSADQVVECHSAREYIVYMIGFLPGFPYMGDVHDAITLPRLETPRTRVPQGSIAIATSITAVYTLESPGGWRILGRTPVSFFNVNEEPPALLSPGDRVVFEPVSREAFERIREEVRAGQFTLTPEDVAV